MIYDTDKEFELNGQHFECKYKMYRNKSVQKIKFMFYQPMEFKQELISHAIETNPISNLCTIPM